MQSKDGSLSDVRIGYGYDVHRLTPGRPLVLGGVRLDHPAGLEGHSDADVLLHAIIDALLGAAGLGDIGHYFPNTEEQWRGASSLEMLSMCSKMLAEQGWQVVNVDATLVAEAPKISPHLGEMRTRIAGRLGIEPVLVNIKATTAEGTGPEGRGEAMSAQAVALLTRR